MHNEYWSSTKTSQIINNRLPSAAFQIEHTLADLPLAPDLVLTHNLCYLIANMSAFKLLSKKEMYEDRLAITTGVIAALYQESSRMI